MLELLSELRKKVAIGFTGGSDFAKISEQLSTDGNPATEKSDYGFTKNGLTACKLGKLLPLQSFIKYVGEDRYKPLVNFTLRYIADLDVPIKRGTFVQFRYGMINVSPIGRNAASIAERYEFETYDKVLKERCVDYNLTYSIGGQISFDVFPTGWDKTYLGGNDHEIFTDRRTIGHTVTNPEDTQRILKELF